jgi:hypothetical protein
MEEFDSDSSFMVPETPQPVRRNFRSLFHEFKRYYGIRHSEYDDWDDVVCKSEIEIEYKPDGYIGRFVMYISTSEPRAFSYFQNYLSNLTEIRLKNGGKTSVVQTDNKVPCYYLIFEGTYELFGYVSRDFEKFIKVRFKPITNIEFLINLT